MVWAGVLVTLVAVGLARLAFGIVLPGMRRDLGLSYAQAGTLGTLTALGYLVFLLPAGLAARRWSSRRSVLGGLALLGLSFLGLGRVSALLPLQLLMGLLGVGTAFIYTPLISLLIGWFPGQRGTVIGLATSGIGLGLFGVGALVPLLAAHQGGGSWRLVWLIFAGVGGLALVLTLWLLRDPPGSPLPESGLEAEREAVPVYRQPRVLGVGLAYGLGGFAFSVQSLFMLSFMLSAGVSAAVAGSLVSLNGLLSVGSGLSWGWLSDRLGRGPAMTLAALLALIATLAPVLRPDGVSFTLHWLVLGATMTGLFTLFQASGSEGVAPADAPLALSAVTLFFALGQLVGPALAGRLIDHAGASPGGGFRLVFALTSLALLLALGLSLWLWRSGVRRGAG